MSLRLFFELTLAAIHFSSMEVELRIWLRSERYIKWAALMDEESGVFSRRFARAFCEELVEETSTYATIASKIYRECSEYVHGTANTQGMLPNVLTYANGIFHEWNDKADSVRLVVSFALCVRYLGSLESEQRAKLESTIMDHVGHIPAIRAMLGGPKEVG